MFILAFYLLVVLTLLIFLIFISIYGVFLIYSSLMGSPYIPTQRKEMEFILRETGLKPGKYFIELGSGDGRMVRTAVEKYKLRGLGIDVNPLMIIYARFLARIKRIKNIEFRLENIFVTSLKKADYLYLFLMPDIIKKLTPKMEEELKKNAVVISHGFKIEDWKKKLFKTIPHSPFPTYFYKSEE